MSRWGKTVAWIIAAIAVAGLMVVLLRPKTAVYAQYADGVRPTVVFVWSDPSPSHPHV